MNKLRKETDHLGFTVHNLSYFCRAHFTPNDVKNPFKADYPPERTLDIDDPNIYSYPYSKKNVCATTGVHMGQRKLFLSEMEFLTKYAKKGDLVVYVGAAEGFNTPFLIDLFAYLDLEFHLYDPRNFAKEFYLDKYKNRVKIFQQFFEDKDAQRYISPDNIPPTKLGDKYRRNKPRRILFISDIRIHEIGENIDEIMKIKWSMTEEGKSKKEIEEAIIDKETVVDAMIMNDMELQKKWLEIIRPEWSMLKMRLPFYQKKVKYLDGTIYLQVWEPAGSSSETRLYVDGKNRLRERTYNLADYNDKSFYALKITKNRYYNHGIPEVLALGFDYCYNCASEIHILSEYLKSTNMFNKDNVLRIIAVLSIRIEYSKQMGTYNSSHPIKVIKYKPNEKDIEYLKKAPFNTMNKTMAYLLYGSKNKPGRLPRFYEYSQDVNLPELIGDKSNFNDRFFKYMKWKLHTYKDLVWNEYYKTKHGKELQKKINDYLQKFLA